MTVLRRPNKRSLNLKYDRALHKTRARPFRSTFPSSGGGHSSITTARLMERQALFEHLGLTDVHHLEEQNPRRPTAPGFLGMSKASLLGGSGVRSFADLGDFGGGANRALRSDSPPQWLYDVMCPGEEGGRASPGDPAYATHPVHHDTNYEAYGDAHLGSYLAPEEGWHSLPPAPSHVTPPWQSWSPSVPYSARPAVPVWWTPHGVFTSDGRFVADALTQSRAHVLPPTPARSRRLRAAPGYPSQNYVPSQYHASPGLAPIRDAAPVDSHPIFDTYTYDLSPQWDTAPGDGGHVGYPRTPRVRPTPRILNRNNNRNEVPLINATDPYHDADLANNHPADVTYSLPRRPRPARTAHTNHNCEGRWSAVDEPPYSPERPSPTFSADTKHPPLSPSREEDEVEESLDDLDVEYLPFDAPPGYNHAPVDAISAPDPEVMGAREETSPQVTHPKPRPTPMPPRRAWSRPESSYLPLTAPASTAPVHDAPVSNAHVPPAHVSTAPVTTSPPLKMAVRDNLSEKDHPSESDDPILLHPAKPLHPRTWQNYPTPSKTNSSPIKATPAAPARMQRASARAWTALAAMQGSSGDAMTEGTLAPPSPVALPCEAKAGECGDAEEESIGSFSDGQREVVVKSEGVTGKMEKRVRFERGRSVAWGQGVRQQ